MATDEDGAARTWVGQGAERVTGRVGEAVRTGRAALLAALVSALDSVGLVRAGPVRRDPEDGQPQGQRIAGRLLGGRGRLTRAEVVEAAGVDLEQATRWWRAAGFAEVGDGVPVFTSADVDVLRDVGELVAAGVVDDDGVVGLARPMGQLLSRLAVAHTELVADVLGERLASQQAAGVDLGDPRASEQVTAQAVAATEELLPALERMTLHVWRRHLASAAGRELVVAAAPTAGAVPRAVGFLDISGFTRLGRRVSAAELTRVLDAFEAVAWDAVLAGGGRVVKTLGDEILFVGEDAASAVRTALTVLDAAGRDDVVPAVHAGVAWGPVLQRGGDVYGPVVNVASRATGLARAGTLRVDTACAAELVGCADLDVSPRAARAVRGYEELATARVRWQRAGS